VVTGEQVRRLGDDEAHNAGWQGMFVDALAFSPDGKLLAACHDSPKTVEKSGIHLWDIETGKELRRLPKSPILLHGGTMAFSPDGKTLLTAVHSLRRWKVSTGEEIGGIDIPGEASSEIALSADARLVAKSTYDGLTLICDAPTGKQLSAIRRPEGTIYRIAFSPDGRFLALCSASYMPTTVNDLAIELWELASGKLVRRHALPRHTGVSSVAFAASGNRLATGMADTTAIIWDMGPPHFPLAGEAGHRLEDHWKALAADDAAKAYQAMGDLIESAGTTAFLEKQLRPATELDTKPILRLIADLDNDEFSVRQKASRELEKLGPEAEPVFRRTLEGEVSPEARRRLTKLLEQPLLPITSVEVLQNLRCVAVLERIGSPEARKVLERLAKGAPLAPLTREAKTALNRLATHGD
jgi:hypothetical protein